MHELSVTNGIYQIVLKHAEKDNVKKVLFVNLEIGALSDLQNEWIQRYFDVLSRGSVAEGAKLNVIRIPAVFKCNQCQQSFEINSMLKDDLSCQICRSKEVTMVSGMEYHVKNIEVH